MGRLGDISARVKVFHEHCKSLGYYPSTFRNALFFIILYVALGPDLFGIEQHLRSFSAKNEVDLVRRALAALVYWLLLCSLRKAILRKLLTYRGWMYEGGNPSLKTKLFVISLRVLCGWTKPLSKSLYDVQGILPSLPLPSVDQTVKKHLKSMKPLLTPSQYAQLEEKAQEFVEGPASKLQRYLKLKWWFTPNYISDWWEEYVYLKARAPLLTSSSYYFVDTIIESIRDQATRAALVAYSSLSTRDLIEKGTFETIMPQGLIPVCNWQYSRMFNTCRIPGETIDHLRHDVSSDHIVVVHKGRYFRVDVYHQGSKKLLSPAELQLQFQRILGDTSQPEDGEDKLADLTTWERSKWAVVRRKYLCEGVNRESLEAIESSAFLFHLDENEYHTETMEQSAKTTDGLVSLGKAAAYGSGGVRWMDKSLNFFVAKNGRAGGVCEHSWGDGMISSHMWEVNLKFCLNFDKFDQNGKFLTPAVETELSHPQRLKWNLAEECLEAIEISSKRASIAIAEQDADIVVFSEFGKDGMKKCRVSPDAYIQMALQLAYYRDQGKFGQTYEPCMTRLYSQGRTETIRSCTEESCRWVLSMENKSPTDLQKFYFKEACDNHQQTYREAMNGRGSDRHLFGLYVVSKYLKTDSPYLEDALSNSWPLSTSQLPIHQTKLKNVHCPAGGFFPVEKDGYGVAYIISGEDVVFFDVNSNKSSPNTDSSRLGKHIRQAMLDIHDLFFPKLIE